MNAREQAREAAMGAVDLSEEGVVLPGDLAACADAASDVWEPLLRDLMEGVERVYGTPLEGGLHEALRRAKEALDD